MFAGIQRVNSRNHRRKQHLCPLFVTHKSLCRERSLRTESLTKTWRRNALIKKYYLPRKEILFVITVLSAKLKFG